MKVQRKRNDLVYRLKKYWILYILAIIPVLYLCVYKYYPIVVQIVLSVKKYRIADGIWGSDFVGLENFRELFGMKDFSKIFINTLRISGLRLVLGFFPPIILAIMLFDMKSDKFRKVSQTVLYIPYFFSWVIVYAIVQILFQNTGYVNTILELFGMESKQFLLSKSYFLPLLIGSGIWKGVGWGTIIYMAALTSVDPGLFEAAKLDGAGPLQRIKYVTIPGILPTIVFVLIINLGRILTAEGTEQILLFYGPANYSVSDTIGTWVYRQGLGQMKYSLSAAVSFFEATIGLMLVLISNKVAQKVAGVGIW